MKLIPNSDLWLYNKPPVGPSSPRDESHANGFK